MAGKWHLGYKPEHNPHRKGFEHSFVNLDGAGNHYDDQGWEEGIPIARYTEDGRKAGWPKGTYSTDLFTDKIIGYIDRHADDGKPFFAFAAYTSPHWPLQVDEPYWRKYEGRYDEGYEVLKMRRMESLKKAGMSPEDAVIPPPHDRVKSIGEYENTLIVFMADKGAAAEDFYYADWSKDFVQAHFNHDYDRMGKPDSFISYGPQWAEAGSAPFRYFKGQTTEGAFTAPMLMSGPGVEPTGGIHHGFTTLMDMAPTFYEIAETDYPAE